MFKQGRKYLLAGAALAAIAFGGSALSTAGAAPATPVVTHPAGATHKANGAVGKTAKEAPGTETADGQEAAKQGAPDEETQDGVNDGETADGAQGAQDSETQDGPQGAQGSETADGSGESGYETAGNDGPSGHADEPGQPNAQNQE